MRNPFAICLVLATIAGAADAVTFPPEGVTLGGNTLAVQFPNGVTCRATVPLSGEGAGDFGSDCPQAMHWMINIDKRNYLEPIFGDAVSPYAKVIISNDSGRSWQFVTPPLPDHDRSNLYEVEG